MKLQNMDVVFLLEPDLSSLDRDMIKIASLRGSQKVKLKNKLKETFLGPQVGYRNAQSFVHRNSVGRECKQ